MLTENTIVRFKDYGDLGIVVSAYENWEDLKDNCAFRNLKDGELVEQRDVDILVHGDKRDVVLAEGGFSAADAPDCWYHVVFLAGGDTWTCGRFLTPDPPTKWKENQLMANTAGAICHYLRQN